MYGLIGVNDLKTPFSIALAQGTVAYFGAASLSRQCLIRSILRKYLLYEDVI